MERKKFYFTFGCGDPVNSGKYVVIIAPDMSAARATMFKLFGTQWAFGYPSAEDAGVEEDGLTLRLTWSSDEAVIHVAERSHPASMEVAMGKNAKATVKWDSSPVSCPKCGSTSFKEAQTVAQYQSVRWNETELFLEWEESEFCEVISTEDVICAKCRESLGAEFFKGRS